MKRVSFFAIILFFVFFITSGLSASTSYIIKKGDNPHTLAKKFNMKASDIIKANNLDPHNLKPGTKISIPSKKKECSTGKKKAAAKARKTVKANTTKSGHSASLQTRSLENASVHVVKRGDTLLSISNHYTVPVEQLKEMNNLVSSRLKVGQKLVITLPEEKDYRVKKGDTVWNIARRFEIDPNELREINKLETDSLKVGQKIRIKPDTEQKELKTYEAILSQAHTEQELETEKTADAEEIKGLGIRERLTLFAKKMLDIPYRFGGNSFMGIDCSAYVKKVYSLIGVNLPRSAREQFQEGVPVEEDELSIGDLVFFRTYASFPSHVGIYLGNNLFIHASSKSKKVTIDSLDTPYYFKRFIGAKRLIEAQERKDTSGSEG